MPFLNVSGRSVPCRAIVFDKDGTLLHFLELWGGWADDILERTESRLREAGAVWTGDRERVMGTLRKPDGTLADYDRAGPLALAAADEMTGVLAWQLYNAGIPWHESVDAVRGFARLADERLERERPVRPLPGLGRLLDEARGAGIKLAVATSDGTKAAEKHLLWAGLDGRFDCIAGRDAVPAGKPAPDLVLECCRRLGVEPGDAIMIGDGGSDMEMAKRAGAALAIGIAPDGGPRGHLEGADIIIGGYGELAAGPV
ncbi:HAD family hydrolase [Saccharibacillus sp. CPCC 101409]|uniref:HAD family hydrolase n=1 Tax=Saccharibacillus sp. CPCC 101409 TaxID=3058041 RepID=UPI0026724EB7|nr:HAD family hydrolase [Saccharibacillus sp. CPCC 101409]MDO3409044.1 HAD family hydrolase [Saccharibacillus sp. CPCC 101409]